MNYVTGAANEHTNKYKQGLFKTVLAITCNRKFLFFGSTKVSFLDCLTIDFVALRCPKTSATNYNLRCLTAYKSEDQNYTVAGA
jgi:hypothetical protein